MKKISILFLLLCASLNCLHSQAPLPVGFSPEELLWLQEHPTTESAVSIQQSGITTPPVSPVRTMAEWEELQGVAITWTSYPGMLKDIVAAAQTECMVYIICSNTSGSDSAYIKNYLTTNSIPLNNLRFVVAPYNSVWMRDYGPNVCYTNEIDSLIMVDWTYNRPTRIKDDTIASSLARDLNIPLYLTTQSPDDLIHTGGNFMSDGAGTAFSSNLVLTENPSKTEAQVNQIMQSYMGINRYIKMTILPYDGIHHIDMHIKLLDEETLLVGEYPASMADGPQIEANIQYVLSTFTSTFGTPYKIIRIPMPPQQSNGNFPPSGDYLTYTNSTFINKTVIVPTYYAEYDTTALRIYREALPGYRIVGINSNASIPASGALHCITHEIGVNDPLLIVHQPLANTTNTGPFNVSARIRHKSGIANATLWWRSDTTQPYASVAMNDAGSFNWQGNIPVQTAGNTVYYYIEAASQSGKTQMRPMPAPDAYWKFEINLFTSTSEISAPKIRPVFPNPSKGITCIPVSSDTHTTGKISLLDVMGREIKIIHEGEIHAGTKNYLANTLDVAEGAYVIWIQSDRGNASQRIVVGR